MSVLNGGVAAIRSGVVRIEHADPVFRYHATFVADGDAFEFAFERVSDGREVAAAENEVSTLRWAGDELVAVDRTKSSDSELTVSWRYQLHDGGRRLRALEQVRGGGRDQDNIWVFERR